MTPKATPTFGFDAVGFGERDEHGQAELLITSGWSNNHGPHSGRIYLISTGLPTPAAPQARVPAADWLSCMPQPSGYRGAI